MTPYLSCSIVSREGLEHSCRALRVRIPYSDYGSYAVLPGHTPLLGAVGSGVISVLSEHRTEHRYHTAGGYVEVLGRMVSLMVEPAPNP